MAARFPSGRFVLATLIASLILWAIMMFGTLAHLSELAEGAEPFDLRPMGYSLGEARGLLAMLGEEGRVYYASVQLALDTIYPALYALSRVLILWWMTTPGRLRATAVPQAWRYSMAALPVIAAGLDYWENTRIAAMLAAGPGVTTELVGSASIATQLKSLFGAATEIMTLVILAAVIVRRLKAGKQREVQS